MPSELPKNVLDRWRKNESAGSLNNLLKDKLIYFPSSPEDADEICELINLDMSHVNRKCASLPISNCQLKSANHNLEKAIELIEKPLIEDELEFMQKEEEEPKKDK